MATERQVEPEIVLAPLRAEDEWLAIETETDPVFMAELGGPVDAESVRGVHARRVAGVEDGSSWYFTIRLGADGPIVGSICVWDDGSNGPGASEIGWGILPAYHGRGIAGAALREVIARARVDGRWGDIHASPGVTNAASNALARSAGFELLGEVEVTFRDRVLRCNDWVLRTG